MQVKICESCGIPMKAIEDFGGQNPDNKYCRYCTDAEGNLDSFEVRFEKMTNFVMSRMGVDRATAERTAKEGMQESPAWSKYFEK